MSRDWEQARQASFDLMIVTCGYESRSTFLQSSFQGNVKNRIVLDYGSEGTHSYDENRKILSDTPYLGWVDLKQPEYELQISKWIDVSSDGVDDDCRLKVLFDVSSCSRSTMAKVLTALTFSSRRQVELTCAYAASAYFDPPEGELPSSVSEPVIGDLSGWSSDLSKPPCAIIGLGFEPGRALGSIDYLEVPEVRLFMPVGPDERFVEAVHKANSLLLQEPGVIVSSYNVLDPLDAYQKLESMVLGILPRFRPIIIPLGPKIFAALSMLVALRLLPEVCIWRTSAGSGEEIADRPASGDVAVFDYVMRPLDMPAAPSEVSELA